MIRPIALIALLMTAAAAHAAPLTIERLFSPPAIEGPTPRKASLSPDGRRIAYLAPSPQDQTVLDLWLVGADGAGARRLVAGAELEPPGAALSDAEKARRERQRITGEHGVTDYAWSEDGTLMLVPAGGRLRVFDLHANTLKLLANVGEDPVDAKISPKGGYVTYVSRQNLHVLNLRSGEDRALTADGGGTLAFGVAEFVAQEEMDRFSGQWASPDDRLIAYTRVDASPVAVVRRLEMGAAGGELKEERYPRAGAANAKVSLFIKPLFGGAAVPVDLGADPEAYLARVDWSKDGRTLYVQVENRAQTELRLLKIDPATGASRAVIVERGTPWINLNNDFTPLTDGGWIWGSERTGFHHLYLYDRDGRLVRPVTQGSWPVAASGRNASGLLGVDEAKKQLFFLASKESPVTRDVYRAPYDRTEPPVRLTAGEGWWSAVLSRSGHAFIGAYSDPKTPPQTGVYDSEGRRLTWLEENRLGPGHPFAPYLDHRSTPTFGEIAAPDAQRLHYALTLPFGFDPSRRYPAIVLVYGGPGAQTVRKAWQDDTEQLLTQAGYVVFRLDNRGSANRGLVFESSLRGKMGALETDDQLTGVRFLAAQPFVDRERIGVFGWSYGGYMTLRLLTEPGSGLRAGAAGAPPTDWRAYDTHYTERYMGDPTVDAAAYDASAVLPRLGVLAKPGAPRLLLVQGMADDNVLFDNSLKVMTALQALGAPFDLMLYPGERHGVQPPHKKMHLWRTLLTFFDRTLKSVDPPMSPP